MARAAHDGLGPRQLDARVITFAERAVAIARQDVADVAEPHGFIRFRVATTLDVEIEHAGLVVDHLDRQRLVLRPERQDCLEAFEIGSVVRARGHLRSRVDRRAADGAAQDVARLLFPDRLAHLVIDWRDNRRLDPAARENAEFAVAFIRAVIHKPKPALRPRPLSNSGRCLLSLDRRQGRRRVWSAETQFALRAPKGGEASCRSLGWIISPSSRPTLKRRSRSITTFSASLPARARRSRFPAPGSTMTARPCCMSCKDRRFRKAAACSITSPSGARTPRPMSPSSRRAE